MRKVTWDAEAGCELNCSTLFYSRRGGEELGNRFLNTVDQLIEHIQQAPDSFKIIFGEVRKTRLSRFPYHVVYWLDTDMDSIHILALAHTSREPGYWKDRL
jgi:hypothetical protein